MEASAVVFIHCSIGELRRCEPFHAAAQFTKWDAIIRIRCDDTGEELQVNCSPKRPECWGWQYFKLEWERKNGQAK